MTELLNTELRAYEGNRDHLLAAAEGKYVLIHEEQILGTYESKMDAIAQGYRQLGNVSFLVKKIVKVETPQYFTSHLLGN